MISLNLSILLAARPPRESRFDVIASARDQATFSVSEMRAGKHGVRELTVDAREREGNLHIEPNDNSPGVLAAIVCPRPIVAELSRNVPPCFQAQLNAR